MLRKKQCIWSMIVICFVLLASMCTTYAKVDSLAKYVIIIDSAVRDEEKPVQKLMHAKNTSVQEQVYLTSKTANRIGEWIGRFSGRNSTIRRDLRLSVFVLWGIITLFYLFRYYQREDVLCLHEKEYRRFRFYYLYCGSDVLLLRI